MKIAIEEQQLFKLYSNPDLVDFEYIKEAPSNKVGNRTKIPGDEPSVLNFGDTEISLSNGGYFAIVASRSKQLRTDLIKNTIESQKEYITGGFLVSFESDPSLEHIFPHSCVHYNLDAISSENRLHKIVNIVKEMQEKGTPVFPMIVLNCVTVRERKFLESSCGQLVYNARHLGIKFIISAERIHEIPRSVRLQADVFTNELEKSTLELFDMEENSAETYALKSKLCDSRKFVAIQSKTVKLFTVPVSTDVVTMGNESFWYLHHIFAKSSPEKPKVAESILTNEWKYDTDLENLFRQLPSGFEDMITNVAADLHKDQEDVSFTKIMKLFSKYTDKETKSRQIEKLSQEVEILLELNKSIERDNEKLRERCKENQRQIAELHEKLDRINVISFIKE